MNYAKQFLDDEATAEDDARLRTLFDTGHSPLMSVIRSRVPIPAPDNRSTHVHADFEFTIPLSHGPQLHIERREFVLPQRNIFPCNPGQYHGPAGPTDNHHLLAIQVKTDALREIAATVASSDQVSFENRPAALDAPLEHLLDRFLAESAAQQDGSELILENLSAIICAELLRTFEVHRQAPSRPTHRGQGRRNITWAIEYLHAHPGGPLSLDEVAKVAHLSKYHFIRVFQQETGTTPYQYFIDLRIARARHLLKTQKYTITEVCHLCGFKNLSHFSRLFTQKVGVPPSLYRKNLR